MHIRQEAPPLNNTWVFIGFASAIKNNSIQSIKVMNRELVLWRTQTGKISLVNAYCTHLGAHLGQGKVKGELLECLFHKRCFDIHGRCQGAGKETLSYPLSIQDNMIFAWFGLQPPGWQMPSLLTGFHGHPEAKWVIFKSQQFNFDFHAKAMTENGVDASHFKIYHHFCESYELPKIIEIDQYRFISQLKFIGYPMLRKLHIAHEIEIIAENIGACTLVINNIVKLRKKNLYFKFLYLATPIVDQMTRYTLGMAVMDASNKFLIFHQALKYWYFSSIFSAQKREFARESKQIWERKSFLAQPDFTAKETAMKKFHDWYSQYYLYS